MMASKPADVSTSRLENRSELEMIQLYGFGRSLAAYRVRVGLNLKGLAFEEKTIDLATDQQLAPSFKAINPQASVPALLVDNGEPLT